MKEFNESKHTIPSSPLERKELIKWVMYHPVWTIPVVRDRTGEGPAMKELLPDSLDYLPSFGWEDCVDIMPVFVNSTTKEIHDNDELNDEFRVWIEAGPPMKISRYSDEYIASHDLNLDCSGKTLENALIELAFRVKHYYGDYIKEERAWLKWHKTSPHGILNKNLNTTVL